MSAKTNAPHSRNLFSVPRGLSLKGVFSRRRDTLELLLPRGWPQQPGAVRWRLRDGAGAAPFGQVMELNQIPGVRSTTRVQVWTPPSESLLTRVTLPTRSRSKIQQALPYALEDQLVGEPEQLHFSYRMLEDGGIAVAVTAKERMQAWTEKLNSAGLRPTGLCPATLALPLEPETWSIAFQGKSIWVRTGISSGFTCSANDATVPPMLELALKESSNTTSVPRQLLVIHPPDGFDQKIWSTQLKIPIQVHQQDFWTDYLDVTPTLNLLQGQYAPTRQIQELLPGLRPAAVMLVIWMVGVLGFNAWEWWSLKITYSNQRAEMERIFRATFPDAKTIQDAPLQLQRLWSELQGKSGKSNHSDVLFLLDRIAPVIQGHTQVKLRSIQYGESKITVDFSLPDFQAMESVKSALTARGMSVEVLNANSTPGGIEGRLRLSHASRIGA